MHVAEFNWGRLRYGWDDPRTAPFALALDRVYALAEAAPGYVWHLSSDEMGAVQEDPDGPLGGDPMIACTLSVWQSLEALRAFSHAGVHGAFVRRGPEWFEPADGPRLVMWHVTPGSRPTVAEGVARLKRLAAEGPSAAAFGWEDAPAKEAAHG